tara:strand:- start:113 stop:565 length:453 start_codon:yes stop_codon:yes gene_type:complete
MSHKWNVYKLFKNGKRAKAPFCVVEAANDRIAKEKFLDEYLEGVTPSQTKLSSWTFVRTDMSQEREHEKNLEKENDLSRKKNSFLGKLARHAGQLPNNICGGLVLCKESEWKWQWAALEPATLKYLKGLSPQFKSAQRADEWLEEQMSQY